MYKYKDRQELFKVNLDNHRVPHILRNSIPMTPRKMEAFKIK